MQLDNCDSPKTALHQLMHFTPVWYLVKYFGRQLNLFCRYKSLQESTFNQSYLNYITQGTNKTGSVVWSGSMDVDGERRTSCANF